MTRQQPERTAPTEYQRIALGFQPRTLRGWWFWFFYWNCCGCGDVATGGEVMSTGLVICSKCRREVHQDGPKEHEKGWRHCEDKSSRCAGAQSDYPVSRTEIVGRWCGQDDV